MMETIIQHNTYPVFESDQVLTSKILNDLVEYLEEQGRATRSNFIGIGPMCGMQIIEATTNKVVISRGCGITSDGHIMVLPQQTFTHFDDYEDPALPPYSFFRKPDDTQIQLLKLEEQKTEDNQGLNELPAPLAQWAVIAYLERVDNKLKNCTMDDCHDKGSEIIFQTRILLAKKEDVRTIICQEEELDAPKSEAQLKNIINAEFRLTMLKLKRFKLPAAPIDHYEKLYLIYDNLVNSSINPITQALNNSYDFFKPVLGYSSNPFEKNLGTLYNDIKNTPFAVQYFYGFLCDLSEAYQEFREAVLGLCVACCPDPDKFPRHLRLGALQHTGCEPTVYRTRFFEAPVHKEQREIADKVRSLHLRMVEMINRFKVPAGVPVKITPDKLSPKWFSKKSIPYYYDINGMNPLVNNWDYDKKKRCTDGQTLSYHATKYSNDDFAKNPLDYRIDEHDFYRIEGILNMTFTQAREAVLTIRKNENLAFDLMVLKVGKEPGEEELNKFDCRFNDLEVVYKAWLKELECILSDKMKIFTGLKINEVIKGATVSGTSGTGTGSSTINFGKKAGAFSRLRDNLVNVVVLEPGAIGEKLYVSLNKEGNITANDFIVDANKSMKAEPKVAQLSSTDYQIAFGYPIEMASYMVSYSNKITDDIYSVNVGEVEFERSRLYDILDKYRDDLTIYNPSGSNVNVDKERLLKELEQLLRNCAQEQLKVIEAELKKRKRDALMMNLFSEFVKTHPGLEHRGGVPRGGTYILVYHEDEIPRVSGLQTARNLSSASNHTFERVEQPAMEMANATKGSISETLNQFIDLLSERFSFDRSILEDLVVNRPTLQQLFPKPLNRTVIADFYLPYLCCSKCPPVAYIMPEARVFLALPKKEFCIPDEETAYRFIIFPETGIIQGPGVTGSPEEGYFFNPNEVALGDASFTVNGEDALTIKIFQSPQVDFSYEIQDSRLLILTNLSKNAKKYTWKIEGRDDIILEKTSAVEVEIGDERELEVELVGENENCRKTTGTRTIIIPEAEKTYFINLGKITNFCSNDAREYPINIGTEEDGLITNPTNDMVTTDKMDGLAMPTSSDPRFRYIPEKLGAGTHKFRFLVAGKEAASASITVEKSFETGFTITVVSVNSDSFKVEVANIKPPKQGDTKYQWDFGAENTFTNDNAQKFAFDYTPETLRKLDNPPSFKVSLIVERGVCTGEFQTEFANPIETCTSKSKKSIATDQKRMSLMNITNPPLLVLFNLALAIYKELGNARLEDALKGELNDALIKGVLQFMRRVVAAGSSINDRKTLYLIVMLVFRLMLNLVRCQEKDLEANSDLRNMVNEIINLIMEFFQEFIRGDDDLKSFLKEFLNDNKKPVWEEMIQRMLEVISG